MYIPKHFHEQDQKRILSLIRKFPFGTVISSNNKLIKGTHIPFVFEKKEEKIKLYSHASAENNQFNDSFFNNEALVIFNGPDAYVSPFLYEKKHGVPTWNYAAVHIYGIPKRLTSDPDKIDIIERMIAVFEPEYLPVFREMPANYRQKMLNGIVAFEIHATRTEAQFKLSNNKSAADRKNIIRQLQEDQNPLAQLTAEMMREQLGLK